MTNYEDQKKEDWNQAVKEFDELMLGTPAFSQVVYEYIHKISRRICPSLDHEEIAMDLWCKCWQEKRMPTYTQVKNHCLDALRKDKVRVKHEIKVGELQFLGNAIAVELPSDIVDVLMSRAELTGEERDSLYRRFYLNESARYPAAFDRGCEKLQRAWKEYQRERNEQE
jgi:hypothetical protein